MQQFVIPGHITCWIYIVVMLEDKEVSDGRLVPLQLSSIQNVENCIQVAYLGFQGREWQKFQLLFSYVDIDGRYQVAFKGTKTLNVRLPI